MRQGLPPERRARHQTRSAQSPLPLRPVHRLAESERARPLECGRGHQRINGL